MTGRPPALSARLREATRPLHVHAERAGVMAALLAGRATRAQYAALLRALHAIYAALESALERHAQSPLVAPVRVPALDRSAALARDLDDLAGAAWRDAAPARHAADYAARLHDLAGRAPERLAAHAYVRYLGDLNGGTILRAVVARTLHLPPGRGVAFYEYGAGFDAGAMRSRLRAGLDALPLTPEQADGVVDEARDAFARHVALFGELADA